MIRFRYACLVAGIVVCLVGCKGEEARVAQEPAKPEASAQGFFDPPEFKIKDEKAREVVEAMYAAYAACNTYSDTGTVESERATTKFETRFKRPYGFYFEFTSTGGQLASGRHVMWTHGDRTQFSGDMFGMQYKEDTVLTDMWPAMQMIESKDQPLGLAIAAFTGISYRAAHTVPRMLFPVSCKESGNYAMTEDLVYEGTKTDRGVECDVLFTQQWGERIFVDRSTRLLRRVDLDFAFGGSSLKTTTLYDPQVDVEIEDGELTFTPPS